MKYILVCILNLSSLIAYGLSSVGGVDGGGGKGVVCRDEHNDIKSVELLDLWEARTLYDNTVDIAIPALGLEAGITSVLNVLKDSYAFQGHSKQPGGCKDQECLFQRLQGTANVFLKNHSSVKRLRGVILELTNDSYEFAKPSTCNIEQIVNYQPGGSIFINQDIYEKLDLANQIALVAHEAYYALLRNRNETNSIRTRRAVGYAMSGKKFNLAIPSLPKEHLYCYDSGIPYAPTSIFFYLNKDVATNTESLVTYPESSHSSKFIALENQTFDYKMMDRSTYEQIATGKCNKDANSTWSIYLGGPVEFDRKIQIDWYCKSGVFSIYFTDYKLGVRGSTTVPLVCKSYK